MTVNFVFEKIDPNSNTPKSNLIGHYQEVDRDCIPYWVEWGGDVNTHLLKDSVWDITKQHRVFLQDDPVLCNLTSKSWDLYTRCEVLKGVPHTITLDIKLETATNCNISILDCDFWTFLGGESFSIDSQLSTSEWKSVSVEMLPSESGFIHLHIGALDSHLPSQEEGTVLIKNLRVKSSTTDISITSLSTQNGSYTALTNTKHNPPHILLSEINSYKNDFNVYPIVITKMDYHWSWPLLLLGRNIVDLINEDKLKILFLCSFEPIVLATGDSITLNEIHRQVETICRLQKITRIDNIIFAATDSSIERRLIEYKTQMAESGSLTPLIKFKDVNAYGYVVPKILRSLNHIDWLEIYCNNYNKPYLFLYFNNRVTYYRYRLYKHLEYKNLLQYGMYSWSGWISPHSTRWKSDGSSLYDPATEFAQQFQHPANTEEERSFINYVISNPDIKVTKIDNDVANLSGDTLREGSYFNPDWIANTYFSVVTETHAGEGPSQVTEKIYKLIFCCHPFIVYGPQHHLETLHRYGFKTFPEMFDESYDLMTESFEKYNFISNQIKFYTTDEGKKKLERLLPILRSTLEYNRNHLLSLSSNDVWNSLKDLYKNN
jgi:hypothetical protein